MDIEIPDGLVAGDEFSISIEEDEGEQQQQQEGEEAAEAPAQDEGEEDALAGGNATEGLSDTVALTITCPLGSFPGDTVSIETER
jgi:hypothetical protein